MQQTRMYNNDRKVTNNKGEYKGVNMSEHNEGIQYRHRLWYTNRAPI